MKYQCENNSLWPHSGFLCHCVPTISMHKKQSLSLKCSSIKSKEAYIFLRVWAVGSVCFYCFTAYFNHTGTYVVIHFNALYRKMCFRTVSSQKAGVCMPRVCMEISHQVMNIFHIHTCMSSSLLKIPMVMCELLLKTDGCIMLKRNVHLDYWSIIK